MDFAQALTEDRRLLILRALANVEIGPTCNDSILQSICNSFGNRSSRDQIRSSVAWLKEQGLVTFKELETGTYVVTITQRGTEAAEGMITVPGVKRPSPGC